MRLDDIQEVDEELEESVISDVEISNQGKLRKDIYHIVKLSDEIKGFDENL